MTAAAGIQENVYTQAKDQFLREARELLRHSNEKQGIGFIDYLEENGTVYRIMKQQHQQEVRKPQPEAKHEPGPQKPQPEPQPGPKPEPQKPQPEPQPPQEKTHAEHQSESDLAALKRARLEAYKRKMEEHRNKKHADQSNENTGLKENEEEPEQEAVNHESVNHESANHEPVNHESLNHEFDPQQLSAIDRFFYNSIIWLMLKLGTKKQEREKLINSAKKGETEYIAFPDFPYLEYLWVTEPVGEEQRNYFREFYDIPKNVEISFNTGESYESLGE